MLASSLTTAEEPAPMNALLCVALLVPAYGDKDIRKALEDAGVRECIRAHFVRGVNVSSAYPGRFRPCIRVRSPG